MKKTATKAANYAAAKQASPSSGGALPLRGFESWRKKNSAILEAALRRSLEKMAQNQPETISRLIEAMSYSLLSGGKRLRPLLALSAAEAVGGRAKEALPAAMAVEMIHAYSLIHDDLPAMDDDALRRGRPACHKAYGEGPAILAGDGLLTMAFEIILGGKSESEKLRRAEAAIHLARSAGALGMVGGQALDLAFEDKNRTPGRPQCGDINSEMVCDMEIRKTGELMSAALVCGAVLGGGAPTQIRTMKKIGLSLGLAFQIQDDLLNLCGDAKLMGKAVGSDVERGKATFPALMGAEEAKRMLNNLADKVRHMASSFETTGQNLQKLIESLTQRNF